MAAAALDLLLLAWNLDRTAETFYRFQVSFFHPQFQGEKPHFWGFE
jgi:hypothetical protein